jgi:hypothetical protein
MTLKVTIAVIAASVPLATQVLDNRPSTPVLGSQFHHGGPPPNRLPSTDFVDENGIPIENDPAANDALMSRIGAQVLCTVDAMGEAQCMDLSAVHWATRGESSLYAESMNERYDDKGLDRTANVLLHCGESSDVWTTAHVPDLSVALEPFISDLPEAREGDLDELRAQLGKIARSEPRGGVGDATILPTKAHSSIFARACGAGGGGTGGSGGDPTAMPGSGNPGPAPQGSGRATSAPSLQQRTEARVKEMLNEQHRRLCGDEQQHGGMFESGGGGGGGTTLGRISEGVAVAKDAAEAAKAWQEFLKDNDGDEEDEWDVEANYIYTKEVDGNKTKEEETTIIYLTKDGKTATYTSMHKRTTEGENVRSSDRATCASPGVLSDACSTEEKRKAKEAVAKKEAAEREAREKAKKEEKEKQQPAQTGGTSSTTTATPANGGAKNPGVEGYNCRAAQRFWSAFVERCDQGEWAEYQCKQLLGIQCANPGIITPLDGGLICANVESTMDEVAEQQVRTCMERGEFMRCIDAGCSCSPREPMAPFEWECDVDPRCNPVRERLERTRPSPL